MDIFILNSINYAYENDCLYVTRNKELVPHFQNQLRINIY